MCEAVELLKQGADLCGSSLTQQIATELLGDAAWLDGHLATVRAAYAGRAHALVSSLEAAFGERISHATVHGGMFCWIEFADATDTTRLLDTAVGHDVAFVPGGAFGVASAHPHAAGCVSRPTTARCWPRASTGCGPPTRRIAREL